MSIAAQNSEIQYGIQPAFIGESGTFDPTLIDYYKVQAPRVATGVMEDVQNLPLRLGGPLTIDGLFKQGVAFGGDFDLLVSPEGSLGILLKAASGNASVIADLVNVGAYDHTFIFDDSNADLPWVSVRCKVPKAGGFYSESGFDLRLGGFSLNIANQGLLSANFQVMGRDFKLGDGSGFTAENAAFEKGNTFYNATQVDISIEGTVHPSLIGCAIEYQNQLGNPKQVTTIGSAKMRDIPVLSKQCSIRLFELWDNDQFRRKILTGSGAGTNWTNAVYESVRSGVTPAIKIAALTDVNMPLLTVPYSLNIEADQVNWRLGKPIELAGGSLIVQEIIGVCVTPTNPAHDYLRATLKNKVASY